MASQENQKVKTLQKSYFDVLGICCPSEVPLIENILKSLDGVKDFSVVVPSRTVIVVHDSIQISQLQIVKALNQASLEANVRLYGETSFKKKWPSPFAVVSGILLALSFLKYVYSPFRWLAVAAVAAGIFPIVSKAFASIRRFRLDINILALIAVIGTIAMKDYTEAGTIVFLFTIAEWLESRASHKASAVMLNLMSLAPQKAVIAETGEEVEVNSVNLNTILAVKAGETVPIDGIVVDGNCEVDEKTLTGEPFPVSKQKDSTIWAGTINLSGYVTVRTTALAEDCVVAKMAKLVEEAQNSKTKTQRFIDKCSQYYTPAIVIVSACFAVIPASLRVHNLKHWFHLSLVVLVSACPCGLILSTPVATFCALTKAATSGLLIKGGDYLETLAKIKVAAFDKTGTITRGEFVVMNFRSLCPDISLRSLLYWVSSIESKSSHPMASTLVDYAKSVSVKPKPEDVQDYQNFPGEGIYGKIDGRDVFIGNKRIALRAGCSTVTNIEGEMKGGRTVGYIFVGERLAGIFNLSDACRSGVAQALKELKSLGIKAAMLTGDNQASAMHAQEQLGNALEAVHAELLPEDKAQIITEFKKEGRTAMVGDGLNDAPALATADIGISMGISGSPLATETGHIILMSNDIRKIPKAVRLARKARRKVIENVILSIAIKGGILALAFSGYPLVWAAVLADVGTCLLVILNSMLLLREKYKPADKCYKTSSYGLNMQKLESSETEDIEAGLLGNINNRHCDSGCCGGKEEEKIEGPKPADSEGSLQLKNTGNCNSDCCGNKTQQVEQNTVKKSCREKPSDSDRGMPIRSDGSCNSSCCGNKTMQAKSCCKEPSDSERGLQMKSFNGSRKSGCCENKKQEKEEIMGQSHSENPTCSEIVVEMKNNESCKSGCCRNKEQTEAKVPEQSCCNKPADSEVWLQVKNNQNCKWSCCGNKEQVKEKVQEQNCCAKLADSEIWLAQVRNNESSKSSCCGDNEQVKEKVRKQSCCTKPVDSETGLPQVKNNENCKSSCCRNREQEKARVLNQSCCAHPADSEVGLQVKNNDDCKSSCCGNNEQVKEKVLKQSCCVKPADSAIWLPQVKLNENRKASSCGNNELAKEKVLKQSCCTRPADAEVGLKVKNNEDHKSSCRGNNEQPNEKVLKQSCCAKPADSAIGMPQAKKDESCKSGCCGDNHRAEEQSCCKGKSFETKDHGCTDKRHHHGGGCCRSYAKECCKNRQLGASGFGGLTEIVIE